MRIENQTGNLIYDNNDRSVLSVFILDKVNYSHLLPHVLILVFLIAASIGQKLGNIGTDLVLMRRKVLLGKLLIGGGGQDLIIKIIYYQIRG